MAIEFNLNNRTKKLDQMIQVKPKVMRKALSFFVAQTPIRTGNARAHTTLRSDLVIFADYPYAERLDTGWSKQAPQGMSLPTEKEIAKMVKDELKRIK